MSDRLSDLLKQSTPGSPSKLDEDILAYAREHAPEKPAGIGAWFPGAAVVGGAAAVCVAVVAIFIGQETAQQEAASRSYPAPEIELSSPESDADTIDNFAAPTQTQSELEPSAHREPSAHKEQPPSPASANTMVDSKAMDDASNESMDRAAAESQSTRTQNAMLEEVVVTGSVIECRPSDEPDRQLLRKLRGLISKDRRKAAELIYERELERAICGWPDTVDEAIEQYLPQEDP